MKPTKVTITLPRWLLEEIDQVVDEAETFRSEVIAMLCEYCFDHEEIIEELFPLEEEGEAETENPDKNGDEA
jgi:metal-responsive CopG/Arc/MetJ family transcriptional regulator